MRPKYNSCWLVLQRKCHTKVYPSGEVLRPVYLNGVVVPVCIRLIGYILASWNVGVRQIKGAERMTAALAVATVHSGALAQVVRVVVVSPVAMKNIRFTC